MYVPECESINKVKKGYIIIKIELKRVKIECCINASKKKSMLAFQKLDMIALSFPTIKFGQIRRKP